MSENKTIVAGLTGSVGMGKSAVAGMLRDMGVPVHDADAAVHVLLGPGGGAVRAVAAAFPEAAVRAEGAPAHIDRRVLGHIVFADAGKKRTLEAILHPLVRAESDKFVARMRVEGRAVAVLDIPLLFETGGEGRVDAVICVSAPHETQKARVLARPGMTEEKFARILKAQMPDAEKRARADYVLDTGTPEAETRAALAEILKKISGRR